MWLFALSAVLFACSAAAPAALAQGGAEASGASLAGEPRHVSAAPATLGAPAARAVGPARPPAVGARATKARTHAPDATMSGFETLSDGSTRVFVELSDRVPYDTKVGRGTITYVLKGARVDRRNNFNPLVTVHFNTPVASARLVRHGSDVWFVVTLRENVPATVTHVTMDALKDGTCSLRVDFPKGEYLPPEGAAPMPPVPGGASVSSPTSG